MTLARTMRKTWAVMIIARAIVGSAIEDISAPIGAFGGTMLMPGSHQSQMLKTRIRAVAETNSGTVIATIAAEDKAPSSRLSRRRPTTTPRKMAIGNPRAAAL